MGRGSRQTTDGRVEEGKQREAESPQDTAGAARPAGLTASFSFRVTGASPCSLQRSGTVWKAMSPSWGFVPPLWLVSEPTHQPPLLALPGYPPSPGIWDQVPHTWGPHSPRVTTAWSSIRTEPALQ